LTEEEFLKPPEVHNLFNDLTSNSDNEVDSIFTKHHNNNYNVTEELTHHVEACDSERHSISSESSLTIQPTNPGWDYRLTPNQAPKHSTADINKSNILTTKRRENSAITSSFKNPTTWKEAISHPDKFLWIEALKTEFKNLTSRGVVSETTLPERCRPVGNSVQFKRKLDNEGNLIKNKVRICAQGFSQNHGIDYDNTFSPPGKFSSLKFLLTIAANNNLEVHHMDAVAAFLNPVLNEDIYMKIPNFLSSHSSGKVWQLQKPLYGLKQLLRYWFLELTKFLRSTNLLPSKADPCMFVSYDPQWKCFIHIHVDNMTVASNNVTKFKKQIMQCFEMEDLGPATFVLGIKLSRNRATKQIFLSQASYIKDLLDNYNMTNCKPVSTPMVYLQVATRADLVFATSKLSHFLEKPGYAHWIAFKHLLRYLAGTKDHVLCLGGGSSSLCTYSDTDYANCPDTCHSIFGFMTMVVNSCINWKSKKQSMVSTSSCEAEYKAQYEGGKELLWSARLLEDLKIPVPQPLQVFGDNQGAISLANNPQVNNRSKHFDIILHWIQEKTTDGMLKVNSVATQNMPADGLTKALARLAHLILLKKILD
ncbi:hypothetical protein O181_112395, partial [Austropuccinia psidii MF-1]|nr:hypothetical protein [Austropuccinia psidii MF-1]